MHVYALMSLHVCQLMRRFRLLAPRVIGYGAL